MIAATRVALLVGLLSFVTANGLGFSIGLGWLPYSWRPAHAHLNLLGFVTLMIYGVAYHAVPRFSGVPFRRPGLALIQVLAHIVGTIGMVFSFGLSLGRGWFAAFGGLTWLMSFGFTVLIAEVLLTKRRQHR
ncbi:MAG TPA: hypothetical protein VK092_04650 [Deinococcales bacterium]|nr:hypothetical protein [Deinococcales bacterium]